MTNLNHLIQMGMFVDLKKMVLPVVKYLIAITNCRNINLQKDTRFLETVRRNRCFANCLYSKLIEVEIIIKMICLIDCSLHLTLKVLSKGRHEEKLR